MRLIHGDLWDYHADGAVIAITTGGMVSKHGRCLMPRGCAQQAAQRFPAIPRILGEQIRAHGLHVYELGEHILSFPIEQSPLDVPDLKLIHQSCQELVELTNQRGWKQVILPRPGCGSGGLSWTEVEAILEATLDDRFLIIDRPQNYTELKKVSPDG